MDSGGRQAKAGERRFRRNGSRRKEDPEPRYEHWCRCARLPANILAVLLLDVDPEDTLGRWLAGCWLNHFEILERLTPEPGTEWTFRLLLELRDIHQYFEAEYRSYKTFHSSDSIDPNIWFEWARDLGLKIPAPFDALITKPSREQLEQECPDLRQQVSRLTAARDASPAWDGFDENSATYPLELDIAHQAWRAVSQRHDAGRPIKEQIEAWIEAHYPGKLSEAALKRIAVVCNWEKTGGKPASP